MCNKYGILISKHAPIGSAGTDRTSPRLSVICYLYVLTFHRISEIHTRSELVLIICVNRDLVLRCFAAVVACVGPSITSHPLLCSVVLPASCSPLPPLPLFPRWCRLSSWSGQVPR